MEPTTGLPSEQRQDVAQTLNILLADEFTLYTKTRNYHWNVEGSRFFNLHAVFEEQYEPLNDVVDEVAERVRAIGCHAIGSLHGILEISRVSEHPEERPGARKMVANLLADYEQIIRDLRMDSKLCEESHGDSGTADFLTGIMIDHEKTAWMVRSTLAEDGDQAGHGCRQTIE